MSFHSRLALRVPTNLLAQKILAGRFCVNTRVPIKALYVCLSVCSKTIQHESTYARDFPCKLRENIPPLVTKHYFKLVHKRMFYIRTNLRMLQHSNVECNIRMLILCNKMMYFGDFVVFVACISSLFIFIT